MNQKKNPYQRQPNEQPQNPQEFISAVKTRFSFPINVVSSEQLEARMMTELETEAWESKGPESKTIPEAGHAPLCWRGFLCALRQRSSDNDK